MKMVHDKMKFICLVDSLSLTGSRNFFKRIGITGLAKSLETLVVPHVNDVSRGRNERGW